MQTIDDGPGCTAVLECLDELLDGELSEDRERAVRQHLDRCPECAAELSFATKLQRELRSLPEVDAPPRMIDQVLATARREESTPAPGPMGALGRALERLLPIPARWAMVSLAAAALAVLVLVPRGPGAGSDPTTDPELARAIEEARFALAYLGDVGRGAGVQIRDEVLRDRLVAPAVRGLLGPSEAGDPTSVPLPAETGGIPVDTQPPSTDHQQPGPRRS